MRSLKSLLMVVAALILVSCSMSAKPEKNETEKVSSAQGEVIVLNKADFLSKVYNYEKNQTQWVYEGNKPAIIDFYADWCGPCKMMGPVVAKCAEAYAGKMKIGKLNVDDNMAIAQKYRVVSIPHFIVFKNGEPAVTFGGAMSEADFCRKLDQVLA